ncbi:tetratricopeptide repeat protein [Prochlorococcus sp. MIT 0916]|uniref:tetratricopeptide repeat protein n=1 Tax=Prochlorococcus sp. MIT 0916 TaxID=3082521 RepID=UPI0039B5F810
MERSEKEGKALDEIKTFPVPFALEEEKKESIISHAPSKEQIINQAFKFHSQGNISEAAKYYQDFINQGFTDYRVFCNYGVILKNLNKSQAAEISYRKAIEINPDLAEAHSNLGNILRDLGKLQEAELSTRKAIEINPDLAEAHSNLGNILRDLGKLQEAELSTRKALKINPDYAEAHFNLGTILSHLGKLQDAFDSYLKVIQINPSFSNIYLSITRFLQDSDPSQLNKSNLKKILNLLLERNDVPHKELHRAFNFVYSNELINNLEILDSDISQINLIINNKVIINALKKIIFCDDKLEELLTKIRRSICDVIAKNTETINYSALKFIISLGEQCFLNEYVYSVTEEENISIDKIINKCRDGEVSEIHLSILSCFFPLYKLVNQIPSLTSFNSYNQSFKELIELHVTEPIKEIELSKNIKKLGSINDDVSKKVKSQYEENPYPRWRYGSHIKNQKISIVKAINNEIKPNYIRHNLDSHQLKVLIAGCGTGNQILHTNSYKNAHVTAIDLSLSSLAYAQRKINELGIDNVELIQMDILEVNLLKKKFDIIECGGVLHHMDDPSKGLKTLLSILKHNGFLKLGLYSELARQDVVKARKYITSKKIQPNEDNIRNFRQKIISCELSELKSFKSFGDFYSLSEFRDLCFHAQEHRFTINQLQETLQSNKLKFLGFLLQPPVKSLYKKYYPEDKKQINLQNWAKFEEKHPNTFIGMYQFWVSKTENRLFPQNKNI